MDVFGSLMNNIIYSILLAFAITYLLFKDKLDLNNFAFIYKIFNHFITIFFLSFFINNILDAFVSQKFNYFTLVNCWGLMFTFLYYFFHKKTKI